MLRFFGLRLPKNTSFYTITNQDKAGNKYCYQPFSYICNMKKIFTIAIYIICAITAVYGRSRKHEVTVVSNGEQVKIYSSAVEDTLRIFVIADTHLWLSDEREEPYRGYSKRMAAAYNSTNHFRTGAVTNPEQAFRQTVALAKARGADVVALVGDILSYPSERGVEFVQEVMQESGLPYYYTCGNHDWHYEGMQGSSHDLRKRWREERLKPLFQGFDSDGYGVTLNGVRLLFIDSSNYEIEPQQLKFIRHEVRCGEPFILFQHIPMYAPSRPVGYGIGHPDWGARVDGGYKIERREPWPQSHTQTDYDYYSAIVNAPNLLATFAGHVHNYGCDIINGRAHFTVGANFSAAYYEVVVMPLK